MLAPGPPARRPFPPTRGSELIRGANGDSTCQCNAELIPLSTTVSILSLLLLRSLGLSGDVVPSSVWSLNPPSAYQLRRLGAGGSGWQAHDRRDHDNNVLYVAECRALPV